MTKEIDFTKGNIVLPLLKFAVPVFLALLLQALYGAVDLIVVGHFGNTNDISGVALGAQIMMLFTNAIAAFGLGSTVLISRNIGEKHYEENGKIIANSFYIFTLIGLLLTLLLPLLSSAICSLMNTPEESFNETRTYLIICGLGSLAITYYNFIGALFRGFGDSNTPLITVAVACVFNIGGDLLFCAVFKLGTKGAALATVLGQVISVLMSLWLIKKKKLIELHQEDLKFNLNIVKSIFKISSPAALNELLIGLSFLVLFAIVNKLGVDASAGIGVAEKICTFIMLVPSSFMQSMATYVSQNEGAGNHPRGRKGLWLAIAISSTLGVIMFVGAFFFGNYLCTIFTSEINVIALGADYLKAYGIDCLLTCFLFCFMGYYNGLGKTTFVMIMSLVAAFLVRIPFAYMMANLENPRMFNIGLSVPISTAFEIIICLVMYYLQIKKEKKDESIDA